MSEPTAAIAADISKAILGDRTALRELDPDKREVTEFRHVHAMPIEEIARWVGQDRNRGEDDPVPRARGGA